MKTIGNHLTAEKKKLMDNRDGALTLVSDFLERWQLAPCTLYSQRTDL